MRDFIACFALHIRKLFLLSSELTREKSCQCTKTEEEMCPLMADNHNLSILSGKPLLSLSLLNSALLRPLLAQSTVTK